MSRKVRVLEPRLHIRRRPRYQSDTLPWVVQEPGFRTVARAATQPMAIGAARAYYEGRLVKVGYPLTRAEALAVLEGRGAAMRMDS